MLITASIRALMIRSFVCCAGAGGAGARDSDFEGLPPTSVTLVSVWDTVWETPNKFVALRLLFAAKCVFG